MKILITPRSISAKKHPSLSLLEEMGYELVFPTPGAMPKEEDLIRHIPSCVAYLAGVEPVTEKVLRAAKDLKVISRNGVGLDNVDLKVAAELGISSCAGANSPGVAELALALILWGCVRSSGMTESSVAKGGQERSALKRRTSVWELSAVEI